MSIKSEYFQAVKAIHEHGSFSAAAKRLGITQSALTKRIQALEGELSHRVFSRSTRQVKLTQFGAKVLELSKQIDKIVDEFFQEVAPDRSKGELVGKIRIGASSSHLRPFVLPAVARLSARNPKVHFEIVQGSIQEIETALLELKVDFAFVDRKANTTRDVVYHLLGEERFVVIRPKNGQNLDRYLGTVPSDPTFNHFMSRQKKSLRPRGQEETFLGDVYSIVDAVALGFGSSIVPDHVVGKDSKVVIDDRYESVSLPFYLAYLHQPVVSKLEKETIDSIRSFFTLSGDR